MSDDRPETPDREHPILWGLVSLVAVATVVGGILGGGALVASKVLGLTDEDSSAAATTARQTMVVPKPSETSEPSDYITLPNVQEKPPPSSYTESPEPEETITLEAGQTSVRPMEAIDLTGSYPGGDGAILRVQQWEDGAWSDFPVTAPVNGDAFYTYIQASAVGENRFRMIDTDTGEASNEIRVRIG